MNPLDYLGSDLPGRELVILGDTCNSEEILGELVILGDTCESAEILGELVILGDTCNSAEILGNPTLRSGSGSTCRTN